MRARDTNTSAVRALLLAGSREAVDAVTTLILASFHPSVLAEFDWQAMRPDSNAPEVLGMLADHVFVLSLVRNLTGREGDLELSQEELERFAEQAEPLVAEWVEQFPDTTSVEPLVRLRALLDSELGERYDPAPMLAGIRETMARSLAALTDGNRVVGLVTRQLTNALYLLLDLPTTRLPACEFAKRTRFAHGSREFGDDLPDSQARDRFATYLAEHAAQAEEFDLSALAELFDWARNAVGELDIATMDKYEGDRQFTMGPCGRCSMWFASETMNSMDTRSDFLDWSNTGLIYLPVGINVSVCPFCRLAAPVESPSMFYVPQRDQVVYLLPTLGFLDQDQAVEVYRPVIESLRARYTATLDDAERGRFDSAVELLTWSLPEYLYTIQMGESVDEAHVFTVVELPGGCALLFDGSKGFARVMTPGEVEWYRAKGMLTYLDPAHEGRLRESDERLLDWLDANPDDDFARQQEELIAKVLAVGVDSMRKYVRMRPTEPGWRPEAAT